MSLADITASIRSAVHSLRSDIDKLKRNLETANQRLEFLESAPLPKNDFADLLCEIVDRDAGNGTAFSKNLRLASKYIEGRPNFDPVGSHVQSQVSMLRRAGTADSVTASLLLCLFADQVKGAIRSSVLSWNDWPADVGPTRAERAVEIPKLQKQIAALTEALDARRTVAKQQGVIIR